jgi:hypothetical protein
VNRKCALLRPSSARRRARSRNALHLSAYRWHSRRSEPRHAESLNASHFDISAHVFRASSNGERVAFCGRLALGRLSIADDSTRYEESPHSRAWRRAVVVATRQELELRMPRCSRQLFGVVKRNDAVMNVVQHESGAFTGSNQRQAFERVEHGGRMTRDSSRPPGMAHRRLARALQSQRRWHPAGPCARTGRVSVRRADGAMQTLPWARETTIRAGRSSLRATE